MSNMDNKCPYCDRPLDRGISISENGDDEYRRFPYLEAGQSAHIECYIKHVVEQSIAQILAERGLESRNGGQNDK